MPLSGVYPCGERERRRGAPGTILLPHVARGATPAMAPRTQNGPKCAGRLRTKVATPGSRHDSIARQTLLACECRHGLRTEESPVADRFRVWACFDDEERSATYAELVGRYRSSAHVLAAHEEAR